MNLIEIGQSIKLARKLKNLNQEDLAKEVGLSQSQISLIEKGQGITLESLDKICQTLGLSMVNFFHDEVNDFEALILLSMIKDLPPDARKVVSELIQLLTNKK